MTQIMDIRRYLGLRGDRQTDRTGQKRSLEARADAFLRLKIVLGYYESPKGLER